MALCSSLSLAYSWQYYQFIKNLFNIKHFLFNFFKYLFILDISCDLLFLILKKIKGILCWCKLQCVEVRASLPHRRLFGPIVFYRSLAWCSIVQHFIADIVFPGTWSLVALGMMSSVKSGLCALVFFSFARYWLFSVKCFSYLGHLIRHFLPSASVFKHNTCFLFVFIPFPDTCIRDTLSVSKRAREHWWEMWQDTNDRELFPCQLNCSLQTKPNICTHGMREGRKVHSCYQLLRAFWAIFCA